MAGTASTISLQGDYTETFTSTVTRAVGATTRTGVRGTLPEPSPDDTNTIWLAPNGNDASAGTQAAPKLTLSAAITALNVGGGLATIQIFRFGAYTGDLIINGGNASLSLPAGGNLQAEEGEIGHVTFSGSSGILNAGSASEINGIYFTGTRGNGFVGLGDVSSVMENCTLENTLVGLTNIGYCLTMGLTDSMNYCHCIGGYTAVQWFVSAGTGGTFDNNIIALSPAFIGSTVEDAQGFVGGSFGIEISYDGTARTWPIDRCVFYGYKYGFTDEIGNSPKGTPGDTINVSNSVFIGGLAAALVQSRGVAHYVTINFDYCLINSASVAQPSQDTTFTANTSIGQTNALTSGLPVMMQDVDAIPTDAEGARLQIEGKSTPNGMGRYFITSPLRAAGDAGVDVAPWDETISGPVRAYNSIHTFELAPATHSIEPEFVGQREVNELNGGSDQDFDALRRVWKIQWTPGRDALNNDWKRLQALLWDKSRKKVYLRGVNGNLLDGFATQAVFDDTDTLGGTVDGSFALQNLSTPGTISMNWYNFWLEVTSGSTTYEYWISSNDGDDTPGTKLYIVDKLGMGLPANGTYDVAIRYFIASLRLEGQPLIFDAHRPGFLDGQRWAEAYDTGSVAPETDQGRLQGKGFSLILVEQTDPKAAPS